MSITLYHNPRCSKSRDAKNLLEEKGDDYKTVLYLTEHLSRKDLESLLDKLKIKAEDLIRKKERIFLEEFKGIVLTEKTAMDALVKYPKLMERPIVVNGKIGAIGRPIENIEKIL